MASETVAQITALLGAENVRADEDARQRVAGSWSPYVAKQKQAGNVALAECVALPGSTEDVARLVQWAAQTKTPLFVSGGNSNTSDSGARGGVALDLARLDGADWDETTLMVTVGAGRTLGDLEEDLNRHEYTLGHLPQSLNLCTVGGSIATNAIGLLSGKYGRQSDNVVALTAVLANGSIVSSTHMPAVYDWHSLLVGTEGQLGIVTQATLKIRPVPDVRAWAPFTFARRDDALDALRLVYRAGVRPASARILDKVAAAALYTRAEVASAPFLLLLAFEGDELTETGPYQLAFGVCQKVGGTAQSATLGDVWWDTRGQSDAWAANGRADALVDMLTVGASWENVKAVETAVRNALAPRTTRLSLQVSHPSAQGCVLEWAWQAETPADDAAAPERLYREVTDRAYAAALEAGGSLFPIYGIGRARRDWFQKSRPSEYALWQTLKAALDPDNLLNPGVVF